MLINSQPTKFPIPWAASASSSYIRQIPVASQVDSVPGAASLTDGFPPLNGVPVAAGGIPPFMQDMNGVLNAITAWLQWLQAGGPAVYDASFATSIGGYPNGAVVSSAVTTGFFWKSIIDNNKNNPDSGGAGWVSAYAGRLINAGAFTSAGTYTYSPSAGTQSIIVTLVGGGGSGGGVTGGVSVGGGGGAGSASQGLIRSNFSNVPIIVGAGGAGVVGTGNNGGTTSFSNIISAPGGGGGSNLSGANVTNGYTPFGGAGGAGAAGASMFNANGQPGQNGLILSGAPMSGAGGPSIFGGGGIGTNNGQGGAGKAPGAGGAGSAILSGVGPYAGASGADGTIIIEEYA